jgi:hypothetical protein
MRLFAMHQDPVQSHLAVVCLGSRAQDDYVRASIRAAKNQRQEETNENVPPLDRCIRLW